MKQADKIYRLLFTALALYLIFLLLRYPSLSLEYAAVGLELWLKKMVPTLLPFMILSGIMIRMDLTENFVRLLHPILHRIYGTSRNGSYTIIMGFLCGFPMGARIVGELYTAGKLSRDESTHLLYFCNNIGPIYFLSYVVSVLAIDKPILPLILMYGIPLIYGVILCRLSMMSSRFQLFQRPCRDADNSNERLSFKENLGNTSAPMPLLAAIDASVLSGLLGIAKLGGYMVFFNLLNILFVPFHHVSTTMLSLYQCILEITSGIDHAGQSLFYPILILLPFGGFSCIAQTYSMIHHTDLPIRPYIFHKTIQTAITAVCYLLIYIL